MTPPSHARAVPLTVGTGVSHWHAAGKSEGLSSGGGPLWHLSVSGETPCFQPRVPKRRELGLLLHADPGFLSRKEPSLHYQWRKLVTEVFMPHGAAFSFVIFKAQ